MQQRPCALQTLRVAKVYDGFVDKIAKSTLKEWAGKLEAAQGDSKID